MNQIAIVLAGGLGTRLRSVISDTPKCMAPIHNKPFLFHQLKYLSSQKIKTVILSIGYLGEQIQNYFGDNFFDMQIKYNIEKEALGTGGAILSTIQTHQIDSPFFFLNGDTYFPVDLTKLSLSLDNKTDVVIATKFMDPADRYGLIYSENSIVKKFEEKKPQSNGPINGGTGFMKPTSLTQFKWPGKFSLESDFFQSKLTQLTIQAIEFSDPFIDIGIPEDYRRAAEII